MGCAGCDVVGGFVEVSRAVRVEDGVVAVDRTVVAVDDEVAMVGTVGRRCRCSGQDRGGTRLCSAQFADMKPRDSKIFQQLSLPFNAQCRIR